MSEKEKIKVSDIETTKVINNTPKNLTQYLDFSEVSTFTKNFKGIEIKLKIPTPIQKLAINKRIGEMLGENGSQLTNIEQNYTRAIVTLDNVVIYPNDFLPSECQDESLLFEIWAWYQECLIEFDKKVKERKESFFTN